MSALRLLASCAVCVAQPAMAMVPSPYDARYVSAYDGDTIRLGVDIWPQLTVHTSVRIRGVDTPEIRGKCDQERQAAVEARDFVAGLLGSAALIQIRAVEPDKYGGRVDANVLVDGFDVSTLLITAGLGRLYNGGARLGWCPVAQESE